MVAAAGDSVFQGHLAPGAEYPRCCAALLRHAGPQHQARLALDLGRDRERERAQDRCSRSTRPPTAIVAFERNFAGRTLALAEITDKAAYREGLPLRGRVLYVPFYDAERADPQRTLAALDAHLARYPGRIAAMLFELVQGEGGYPHRAARVLRAR